MEHTMSLDLITPIPRIGKEPITTLELREPKLLELMTVGPIENRTEANARLISLVSGQSLQNIQNMGTRDYTRAMVFLDGFFAGSQPTGDSSE